MKTFTEIRTLSEKSIFKKKMGKFPVEIRKEGSNFVAYVDGDKLDKFRSEKDAKKGIEMAIKALS